MLSVYSHFSDAKAILGLISLSYKLGHLLPFIEPLSTHSRFRKP